MLGCRNFIVPEDLMYFLPTERVKGAFSALDTDCDGRISLADIRDAVLQVQPVLHHQPCAALSAQALHLLL